MIYRLSRTRSGEHKSEKRSVERFAKNNGLVIEQIIEQEINNNSEYSALNSKLLSKLETGDTLIVSEISVLGPSFATVIDLISKLIKKKIDIYSTAEPIVLVNKQLDVKTVLKTLMISSTIERFIIGQRANRGLNKRKASGSPLGRPKGQKSKTTKLSAHEGRVKELLNSGIGYSGIGRILNVNRLTVKSFVERTKLTA